MGFFDFFKKKLRRIERTGPVVKFKDGKLRIGFDIDGTKKNLKDLSGEERLEVAKNLSKNSKKNKVNDSSYEDVVLESKKQQASRHRMIIDESIELLNNTTNPSTFFSRYDLLIEHVEQLAELLEEIDFVGDDPNDFLKELEEDRAEIINGLISRIYGEVHSKISGLKTRKAKINNAVKFKNTLIDEYGSQLTGVNIEEIDRLYNSLEEEFDLIE